MAIVPEVVEARSMARRYDNLARLAELKARAGEVEVRSPVAATQPSSSYQTPGKAMIPNWDPATAIRMGYMANFVVSRCFNIIANDVAGCAFLAGLDRPRQPGQVVDHNPAARLAQLLGPPPGGPAPKLTGRRLVHWSIIQRKATGYCGWEIETTGARGKGEIVALWPLVSANLRAVPSTSGSDWWQGFEYGPDGDVNKVKRLTPEQVFYGWDPSAEDFRQPESVLQSARLDVSIAVMSARYAYGFLRNDARPATVVVTDAFESDEAYHAFRSGWYGQFGGPENAGKAAFLEMPEDGALKPSEAIFVQTLGLSQKQAQFMEQHQASLERVAMACGVPWSRFSAAGRCVDDETEALTQRGWVTGADLTTDDTILSMDVESGRLTWSPVREIYRAHYSGPMHRLRNKHADWLVTPGHNWAVKPRPGQGRKNFVPSVAAVLRKVEDIRPTDQIVAMGNPENSVPEAIYSAAFVELVGWAVTEGCYDSPSYIRITQNEGANSDRIRATLKETGALWSEGFQKDREHLRRFYVRGEIARAITAISPGKIMVPDFLVALTAEQRELLLQTMIDADGARQRSTASWIFTQKDRRAAEAFSMLATLAGYTTSMRYEPSGQGFMRWRVIVRQRKAMTVRRDALSVEHYDGMVWCPRTDFGTFVARRHGRVVVTGNTYDNAGQEDEGYWVDTILPLVTDFADEINMQIAPRLGRETGWFDLSHVGVFQPKRRFASLQDAAYGLDHEVVVVDEVREDLGLGPAEWGGTEPIQPPAPIPLHVAPAAASAVPGELRTFSFDADWREGRTAQVHSHWHTHADGVIHRHLHRHRDGVEPHGDWANVTHSHSHPETLSIEVGEARGGIVAQRQPFGRGDQGPEFVVSFTGVMDSNGEPWPDLRGGADDREAPEQAAEGSPPSEPVLATSPHDQRDAATERRTRTWRAHDATVRTLEKRTERVMRKLFARQEKAVLSRLEGNRGRRAIADGTPNPDEVFDPGFWSGETADDAEAFYEQIATAGFARLSAQFGISFDLEAPFARDFVQARANQLAGQVTDTTYQAIKDQLSEGVGKGESIPDLAARIRGVFDEATKNRSTLIARTEVSGAMNGAVALGAAQLPSDVAGGQEWIATPDARSRDDHIAADGQIVAIGESFDIGGEQLAYPGDPAGSPDNVCNCRCTTAVLTPDEMPDAGTSDQQAAGAQPGEHRISIDAAAGVLATVDDQFDEGALRRALMEVAA